MSRRQIIRKHLVLNSADSTTDPSSDATDVSGVDHVTYEIQIGGSVDADLEVYFCNDANFSASASRKLDFGQATPLLGSDDTSVIVHISNRGFKWLFIKVVNSGGTGNVSAWIAGTGVGA